MCTRRRARRHDVAVERRAAREGRERYVSLDLATRRVVFRRVTSDHHPHAPRCPLSDPIGRICLPHRVEATPRCADPASVDGPTELLQS